MTDELTPQQKAAITRAANKAAREAEAVEKVFAEEKIDPTVETILETVDNIVDDPTVQATISKVTPKIGAKARAIIYNIGFYAGLVGTVAPIVAASLTGDSQIAVASIGAVALAFNSWLAKANLSKTAEDIAKENDTA